MLQLFSLFLLNCLTIYLDKNHSTSHGEYFFVEPQKSFAFQKRTREINEMVLFYMVRYFISFGVQIEFLTYGHLESIL